MGHPGQPLVSFQLIIAQFGPQPGRWRRVQFPAFPQAVDELMPVPVAADFGRGAGAFLQQVGGQRMEAGAGFLADFGIGPDFIELAPQLFGQREELPMSQGQETAGSAAAQFQQSAEIQGQAVVQLEGAAQFKPVAALVKPQAEAVHPGRRADRQPFPFRPFQHDFRRLGPQLAEQMKTIFRIFQGPFPGSAFLLGQQRQALEQCFGVGLLGCQVAADMAGLAVDGGGHSDRAKAGFAGRAAGAERPHLHARPQSGPEGEQLQDDPAVCFLRVALVAERGVDGKSRGEGGQLGP